MMGQTRPVFGRANAIGNNINNIGKNDAGGNKVANQADLPFLKKLDNFISSNRVIGGWLKKFRDKVLYNFLAWRYGRHHDWVFMNYGYRPNKGNKIFSLEKKDAADRYCIEMYRLITQHISLDNTMLLEVGCGRGGGASFLARYFKPKKLIAIDIAKKAIDFCRKKHRGVSNLEFEVGDGEKLWFYDYSFDAVINIESVQGYGNINKFLSEVERVLMVNGYFFCTTFMAVHELDNFAMAIRAAGLDIVNITDLTPNVLAALDADNDRKKTLIDKRVDKKLLNIFYEFAGLKGSEHYKNFASGKMLYQSFLCQKR